MKTQSKYLIRSSFLQFQDQSITRFLTPFSLDILLIFDHRNGLLTKKSLDSNANIYKNKFIKYKTNK